MRPSISTGRDPVMERPLHLLVHYLLGIDVLCLITRAPNSG